MSNFIVKFDTRSARVKGLCFHNKRPWVIIGLHNGMVQIWDYRTHSMVDKFEEHEGPVRGVDFHSVQPIFATGGDDYKIKIWNHKLRRCLYTLLGHLDYIRTVQFHSEQPWLVSASDDQTLRIWNWQGRSCISVLTGHNHYVMCGQFHPRLDMIISASLDLTIRIWDISGLRSKKSDNVALPQDLFGSSDAEVKCVLEGHEKGVNWAAFHPTKNFAISAADDRSIRVWRLDEGRGFEVEQLRGHTSNVSCVRYFGDLVVSNSEDRTIRVWDQNVRTALSTFRRDSDRFWILAVHPEQNLLAAGHDSGLILFKIERERPPFCIKNDLLYFIKDRKLRVYNFKTKDDAVRRTYSIRSGPPPRTLSVNSADETAVHWNDTDGGIFEMYGCGTNSGDEPKKGFFTSAVFFAANKFACLDKTRQITIRTSSNEMVKVLPPVGDSDTLFPGPQGFLICRSDDKCHLYDVAQKRSVAEISVSKCKYVIWDGEFQRVAFQSKNSVVVASRRTLKAITTVTETARIKSCAFDEERPVLFYATNTHLKYCSLQTGETGTLMTLEQPVYLVKANADVLWYIERNGAVTKITVDNTELNFKFALQQERYREVLQLIKQRRVHGQALVAYLHKHGHPEIAMHFVEDPIIKFNLAISCGMMDVAKKTALEANNSDCWRTLATAAVKCGDIQLAQLANTKVRNFPALGLQCAITGNFPALEQVMQKSNDDNFKLQYSMVTGDAMTRIQILARAGQLPLAYATAKSNGLEELAEEILSKMDPEVAERSRKIPIQALRTRTEVAVEDTNWPLLPIQESYFTRMLQQPGALDMQDEETVPTGKAAGAWGDDDDLDLGEGGDAQGTGDEDPYAVVDQPGGETGGEWDDDIDIDPSLLPAEPTVSKEAAAKGGFVLPREGDSCQKHWVDSAPSTFLYHVAAGSFPTALNLLQRQIALNDGEPLKQLFLQTWVAANASMPSGAELPSHVCAVTSPPGSEDVRAKHAPRLPPNFASLKEKLKVAYGMVTSGQFVDALKSFQGIMHQVLFLVLQSKNEVQEARELLAITKEYAGALSVELARKEYVQSDPKRAVELSVYFTHFKLQNVHLILALSQAMSQTFKAKCLKTAGTVGRRLLDLDPPQERAVKAKQVVKLSDDNPTDALKLDYDDRNPYVLCCMNKKPMYRGAVEPIRCAFCQSYAHPSFKGQKCPVCLISTLGGEGTGISFFVQ